MVWFTLALVSLSPKPFLATEYIKAAVVTGGFRYLRLLRTPSLPVATQCLQVSMRGTPFINRAPLCMTFGTAGVLAWLQMRNAKNSKKEICSPSLSTQEQTALIVARVHCGEYACIYRCICSRQLNSVLVDPSHGHAASCTQMRGENNNIRSSFFFISSFFYRQTNHTRAITRPA